MVARFFLAELFLAELLAMVAFSCAAFCDCGPVAGADDLVPTLNKYMDASVEAESFNGSVLVAQGDRVLLSKGYGFANFEHDVANKPITKFRIGSITKQFTAMAIMVLVDRGKLDVQDTLGKHLEDAPEVWKDVTVHQLLTHTSGIASFTNMPQYRRDMMLPQSIEQMLARIRDKPLEFAPGERFRYSNSGYYLLGAVVKKVSARSYEEFLRKEICQPLGLNATGYDRFETVLKHRATGYARRRKASVVHAPYLNMTQPYAAGAMYSTVEDLHRWDRALRERKLISKSNYDKLFTPAKRSYAYGWRVTERSGRRVISHGGGINGFASYILRVPEEKLCVVALCNVQPSSPSRVANDLASIMLGEEYELPKARRATARDKGRTCELHRPAIPGPSHNRVASPRADRGRRIND